MYSFKNDYSEGAHQKILQALLDTNTEQMDGYGQDRLCIQATKCIKDLFINTSIDIHYFSGGTQTNLTAISAFLRPHEAVIAAESGHILVHETGAIEATGHKVIAIPTTNGKITGQEIETVMIAHEDEHMVLPKLVYISNSTETGTIYSRQELDTIKSMCTKYNLYLYMDGARLGSAMTAADNDVNFEDLTTLFDAFYIGGTKNGALLGEALVICRDELKAYFRYHIKQKGALLAKGRLLGIQFLTLFKDDLYFDLAKYANTRASELRTGIKANGYDFLIHSTTNQVFPILPNHIIDALTEDFDFYVWSAIDEKSSAIRLVTSWATPKRSVDDFIHRLSHLSQK
jgi:threonine aldolase